MKGKSLTSLLSASQSGITTELPLFLVVLQLTLPAAIKMRPYQVYLQR